MRSRQARIGLAEETERILRAGRYHGPAGEVDVSRSLARAVSGTVLISPGDELVDPGAPASGTTIEVTEASTLEAVNRLVAESPDPVLCLNFASATHPGGGFEDGARGQEEDLARASGLMACLRSVPRFYEFHRALRDPIYSDHMVYSPAVPVFRDDTGGLLARPYPVAVLTSAAPNATELAGRPDRLARIPEAMSARVARVLSVAAAYRHRRVVLGAWGCGAFGNDPDLVADAFAGRLGDGGAFANRFEHVVFAILPSSTSPNLAAFRRRFT